MPAHDCPKTLSRCLLALTLIACTSGEDRAAVPVPAPLSPVPPVNAPPPPPPAPPADPNEACARILVVAWQGAAHAPETITRDKHSAKARALELLTKITGGSDFATLARTESDAPTSAARDGIMGTHMKTEWPPLHAALRDPVFSIGIGQLFPNPVETEYGYALVQRCPLEKARSRHILVRYKGAKGAPPKIKRTKAQAETRAKDLLAKLEAGTKFEDLAKTDSDDASGSRGGDIGIMGRGLLAPTYEQALFALKPGERSPVVETDFGFHIIERVGE